MFEAGQIAKLPADTLESIGVDPIHVKIILDAARDAALLTEGGWLVDSEGN